MTCKKDTGTNNTSSSAYEQWLKAHEEAEQFEKDTKDVCGFLINLMENGIPEGQEEEYKRNVPLIIEDLNQVIKIGESMKEVDPLFDTIPMPLDAVDVPRFPVECLPDVVRDYVVAVAESTQTTYEMAGILSLGVLASVMQGKAIVEVKPGYTEQLSVYAVAIAESGERKSAVIKHLTEPIPEYERSYNKQIAPAVEKNKLDKRILDGAIKQLEKQAIRGTIDDDGRIELDVRIKELAEFKELHPLRIFVNDATPEKLIDIMDKQGGKIAICTAEGNLFDMLAAKNDRGTSLMEPLLKGHAGDSLTVDRLGREGNFIAKPHISTILTVQPHVIEKVIRNSGYSGRGLLARFLFVKCGSYVGERSAISPIVPEDVKKRYRNLLFELLAEDTVRTFDLSEGAKEEWQRLHDVVEKRLLNEWHFMGGFGSKFVGMTVRLAALIHGAEDGRGKLQQNHISGETFRRAIKIAECLGKHAEFVYLTAGCDERTENAKYIMKRLESVDYKTPILKSEFQALCQRFKTAEEMEAPVKLLVEKGYLKCVKDDSGGKGRPKELIYVNWDLFWLKAK